MKCENKQNGTQAIDQIVSSIAQLVNQQATVFNGVVNLLQQSTGGLFQDVMQSVTQQKTSTCCDIPEPCWMPLEIAEIECALCPGVSGVVRLRVTNMDFRSHNYTMAAAGADAGRVSFDTPSFTLGPKERRTVTATFKTELDNNQGCPAPLEALIWVMGCRNHYLRWTIKFHKKEESCCYDVDVHDTPDYVLHWYDHFYHPRDCFGTVTSPQPQPQARAEG